jgi:hypothetical protein
VEILGAIFRFVPVPVPLETVGNCPFKALLPQLALGLLGCSLVTPQLVLPVQFQYRLAHLLMEVPAALLLLWGAVRTVLVAMSLSALATVAVRVEDPSTFLQAQAQRPPVGLSL